MFLAGLLKWCRALAAATPRFRAGLLLPGRRLAPQLVVVGQQLGIHGIHRGAESAHTVVDSARPEAPLGYLEAATGTEDDIVFGHPHIGESLVHMAVGGVIH